LAGRYREALEASERTLEEADLFGVDFVVSHALVGRARALIGLRRFGAARQVLNRLLGKLAQESDPWLAGNLAMQQARLCISLGDLDRAADHLLLEIDELLSPGTRAEYDAYRALIEAARGRRADARRWIRSALHSSHVEARAVVFAAQSILGLTDATGAFPDAALRPFEAVLESGHRDAVVMACRAHPELARRVVEHGASSRALRGILLGSGDSALARAAGLRIPRTARRTDLLTPRELEVYELMAQARTNREIAQSLFISESTTKVHVRHIFEKLGVRSRVEAVRALHPG
jgi:DNA-binding CsgD family transcriptional regulator